MQTAKSILGVTFSLFIAGHANAQPCSRCPLNATVSTSPGSGFGVFVHRGDTDINVSGGTVGSCETIILKSHVAYNQFGISGGIGAAFAGGIGHVFLPDGTTVDVTPNNMATTIVGPAPCGNTNVASMKSVNYIPTATDIMAGYVIFTFEYTNGIAQLPDARGQCVLNVSASLQAEVTIAPKPTGVVMPTTNSTFLGSSASFTVSGVGTGPFTYTWSGPNGFTSTNATITITNVQPMNTGVYTAVVADAFGFSTNVSGTLAISPAQTCTLCPANATDTSSLRLFGVFVNRGGIDLNVSGGEVGACETIILKSSVAYTQFGISGGIGAAFTGGTGHVFLPDGRAVDVTPDDMATTIVGPAPCGTTSVKLMKSVNYIPSEADKLNQVLIFTFEYTNAVSQLPDATGQCRLRSGGFEQNSVLIVPAPIASVSPSTNPVCLGSSAYFTVAGTGAGPFSYSWSGPNGFSSTNATITITNVQPVNVGIYTAIVTDKYGCSTNSSGVLAITPRFTSVSMEGSNLLLSGCGGTSNGVYTILTATNLSTNPIIWLPVGTNTFDAMGQFTFTNSISLNDSKRFFRILTP